MLIDLTKKMYYKMYAEYIAERITKTTAKYIITTNFNILID